MIGKMETDMYHKEYAALDNSVVPKATTAMYIIHKSTGNLFVSHLIYLNIFEETFKFSPYIKSSHYIGCGMIPERSDIIYGQL